MKSLLLSGKVKHDVGGQVLDIYNQAVMQGISPTIKTTIDTSNMTFVTIMNKEIIHTAPNGKKYSIQIRKYTPRDCFRLMGVHEADIDKLLRKEKTGQLIISKSKLYALAGNSIVTNCLTAMFEELIFPSGISLPRQDWSAITLLAYGYFWIYQDRQAYQQSAQSHVHPQDHGNMVQRQPNHRNNARWLVVPTRLERNVGTINVPVRSHTRLIFTFAK
jgi:hypothetical protein